MRPEWRCHDQGLTAQSIFIVSRDRLPEGTPLRLVVPAVPAALEPLLSLVRAYVPGAREIVLELGPEGPDAESSLIDYWTDLHEDRRSRVWGVVGPLAGLLARFPGRTAVGFALLSSTAAEESESPNAQARSLLTASVADSWSLALDAEPPVDADSWRARLWSVVESWWGIGLMEGPDAVTAAFREALLLDVATLAAVGASQAFRNPSGHSAGRKATASGWLDRELLATGVPLMRASQRAAPRAQHPGVPEIPSLSSKVIRGKRGRLFLTRDSHDSHRQIVGGRSLSGQELDAWARGTSERIDDLSALGCQYRQIIGPAPQVVHPEDLPDGVSVGIDRPVQQVLTRLEALHPRPDVLYPLEALQRARDFRDPFSKTDSHWNDLGAYLAYETILDSLHGELPVRRLARDQVTFNDTCYVGDLGTKLRPERASIFVRARVDSPRARMVEDNRVRNHGRRAVFECAAAPPTTCVVFGDSWAYSLMLFIAESFRRVVFFHRVNVVDRAPILAERPDLALSVMTERFCTALPLDREAVDFDLVVARKLELKDVVPEPAPHERHPFLFSLALDRGLTGGGFHLPR